MFLDVLEAKIKFEIFIFTGIIDCSMKINYFASHYFQKRKYHIKNTLQRATIFRMENITPT